MSHGTGHRKNASYLVFTSPAHASNNKRAIQYIIVNSPTRVQWWVPPLAGGGHGGKKTIKITRTFVNTIFSVVRCHYVTLLIYMQFVMSNVVA